MAGNFSPKIAKMWAKFSIFKTLCNKLAIIGEE